MKNIFAFSLILLFCACGGQKIQLALPDGYIVKAEVADTPAKTEKGLMYRKSLAQDGGMLFIFDKEAPRVFWMKNTFIDLDMIFIAEDGTVNSVAANVPRSYSYTPDHQVAYVPGRAKYVLELPAGSAKKHNIEEGSKIEFKQ